MVAYLGNWMEDATELWQGAMVAHAILLCEMECGSVTCTYPETCFH